MEKNKVINVDIMMGLPGSGKSTFAKEMMEKDGNALIVDVDSQSENYGGNIYSGVCDCIHRHMYPRHRRVILDGLFLTTENLMSGIEATVTAIKKIRSGWDKALTCNVTIHRWDEDRETCLKNDGGRREKSSAITILNAPYEEPCIPVINEVTGIDNISIVRHKVVLKGDWELYYRKKDVEAKDGMLYSCWWITGGSYGNCYDDSHYSISSDEPLEFTELHEFLENNYPMLSFSQYREISHECVSVETMEEGCYYGGSEESMRWVCNLEKMYKLLKGYGYIEEKEEEEKE